MPTCFSFTAGQLWVIGISVVTYLFYFVGACQFIARTEGVLRSEVQRDLVFVSFWQPVITAAIVLAMGFSNS